MTLRHPVPRLSIYTMCEYLQITENYVTLAQEPYKRHDILQKRRYSAKENDTLQKSPVFTLTVETIYIPEPCTGWLRLVGSLELCLFFKRAL